MAFGVGLLNKLLGNKASHGAFYNAVAVNEQLFYATRQSGVSMGTALTATAVTLTLYNPVGSGVRVVVRDIQVGMSTAPSGAGTALYVAAVNSIISASAVIAGVAENIRNCLLGGTAVSSVLAYQSCTLPSAPRLARVIGGMYWATAAAAAPCDYKDHVDGALILVPNTAVTIQGVGVATSGIPSIVWEEVPYIE